jgi:hypothetical protein
VYFFFFFFFFFCGLCKASWKTGKKKRQFAGGGAWRDSDSNEWVVQVQLSFSFFLSLSLRSFGCPTTKMPFLIVEYYYNIRVNWNLGYWVPVLSKNGDEMRSQDENSTQGNKQGIKLVFSCKFFNLQESLIPHSSPLPPPPTILYLPSPALSLLLIFFIKSSLVQNKILQNF